MSRVNLLFRSLMASILILCAGLTIPVFAELPNRFIILSDLHPHPEGYEQLARVTDAVIEQKPAFVIVLGDIGGDEVPGVSEKEIESIRVSFNKMRAEGIEVFPVMGNHDVHHRVIEIKSRWFLEQTPLPLNHLFDVKKKTEAWQLFSEKGPFNYSFNRGGIHFVIIDSNCFAPRENWEAERKQAEAPRWERHRKWMEEDLCKHQNNPSRYPSLVFLHHPEYMTGDRGMTERPLYTILADCPEDQTVRAVFGGHWHYGQNFSKESNLGIPVYATPVSVLANQQLPEYIVADVDESAITFTPWSSNTLKPMESVVHYEAVHGRFSNLREDSE